MSELALSENGPEANLRRSAEFEDQLVAMARRLGWDVVARSADVLIGEAGGKSRGVDTLLRVNDPQEGLRTGYVLEAKVHKDPAYAEIPGEAAVLLDKINACNGKRVTQDPSLRKEVDFPVRHGLLVHRSDRFRIDTAQARLSEIELRNRKTGRGAPIIEFLAPDVLQSIGDLVLLHDPVEWFWPPYGAHPGTWSPVCPPHQLAEGLLGWRNQTTSGFLLRDTLEPGDAVTLSETFRLLHLNPDVLTCSALSKDRWRAIADRWLRAAKDTASRPFGRLPANVEPRDLPAERLNRFDDAFPADQTR